MSIDSSAGFGYGFEITGHKVLKGCNDLEELENDDCEIVYAGDSYLDSQKYLLCISKSVEHIYTWEGGAKRIDPKKLAVQKGWDAKLLAWAKEHKVNKPKIGWWLTVSVG